MNRDDGLHAPKIDLSDLNLDFDDYDRAITMAGAQPTISIGSGVDTITVSDLSWPDFTNNLNINSSGRLDISGPNADIMINGVSLCQSLEKIKQRLEILTVNPVLENEWDQLRAIGDEYRRLETELLEKSQAWKALKKL
jgi:hypothetical protein